MTRIVYPISNAKRVKIGAQYVRPWFEERRSDGSYASRMPAQSADGDRLQSALLYAARRTAR